MPDPIVALQAHLAADADVAALAGDRVFGEWPEAQDADMPRGAVLITHAGSAGAFGAGWADYGDLRFDIRAYGENEYLAARLWRAVHRSMKMLTREVSEGVLLHWARTAGGPNSLRDPDTPNWPYVLSSWQVLLSEVPA